MATAAKLIPDPLFQQNVILWLAQEGPPSGDIEPVLHAQGFGVLAVGRLLSLPPQPSPPLLPRLSNLTSRPLPTSCSYVTRKSRMASC